MADDSPDRELPLAVAMSSSAVVAALAAGDDPVQTIAAATAPLVVQAAAAVRARWVKNSTQALQVAADHMGVGLDILLERSTAYDERLKLMARVIEASARSTVTEKIDALGRVLALGLSANGDTAEALLLASGLAVLEAPHIEVLGYLAEHPLPTGDFIPDTHPGTPGWQVGILGEAIPALGNVMDALLAVLSGQGLIRDATGTSYAATPGPATWVVAPLGERCLLMLDPRRES
ncbi:hypothetical protein [Blastococcus tunisiensis]|uniref:hypothetical protein n=1 Tax=Blastococcus tunisiensis TaxID=1798228 RepID=UPI001113383A|nr:hypothetical protein [Blastococcus sp. DSM 46838]